jgi:cysteine desulfurase / selenocysteine lyase
MDLKKIKKDFPILKHKINGKRLVYLDSAATSQKPKQVVNALKEYYETSNANTARSIHTLAERATERYEDARKKVATFIGAEPEEVVFAKSGTEALNLAAHLITSQLKEGDEIVLTVMEHHSNIVPWQVAAEKTGAKLRFVDILPDGRLDINSLRNLVTSKTKAIAVAHVSNVLGTINPIKEIVSIARQADALVLVDGAQAAPHIKINVKELGVDFYTISGHKMLGPMGSGVIYAKKEHLEKFPPMLTGGHMIKTVTLEKSTWNDVPHKFEAGTASVADIIGLGAAVDYLKNIGMENIRAHEIELTKYALEKLSRIKDIEIYGPKDAEQRGGVISFNIRGAHPHDVAQILDSEGIAIRSGHACAMPLMQRLGVESVCRASFYIYNTKEDVDALTKGLEKVKEVLKL